MNEIRAKMALWLLCVCDSQSGYVYYLIWDFSLSEKVLET